MCCRNTITIRPMWVASSNQGPVMGVCPFLWEYQSLLVGSWLPRPLLLELMKLATILWPQSVSRSANSYISSSHREIKHSVSCLKFHPCHHMPHLPKAQSNSLWNVIQCNCKLLYKVGDHPCTWYLIWFRNTLPEP